MDDRIVVRESKKAIKELAFWLAMIVALFGGLGVMSFLDGDPRGLKICMVVLTLAIPIFSLLALEYFLRRLELGYRGCLYRTTFGHRRTFSPGDVAEIQTKRTAYGDVFYYLIGQDGKKLARIEKSMVNFEKVITFFETYNASAIWTDSGWVHPKPVRILTYGEKLIVKPNKYAIWHDIVTMMVLIITTIGLIVWKVYSSAELGLFEAVIFIGLVLGICFSFKQIVKDDRKTYKNLCLVLTPGTCSFTDEKGNLRQFEFDEIAEIKKVREGSQRFTVDFLEIRLNNGDIAAKVAKTAGMDNVGDIVPFVEHHRHVEKTNS